MLPAAGQGILAVQGRKDVDYSFLSGFFDKRAEDAALAERAFVRYLGGGCSSPVAAYAVCEGEELVLTGLYYSKIDDLRSMGEADRSRAASGDYSLGRMRGKRSEAEELGRKLAERMRGGDI